MKLIVVAILFALAAWLGTLAGHWADSKAQARIARTDNLIEELSR